MSMNAARCLLLLLPFVFACGDGDKGVDSGTTEYPEGRGGFYVVADTLIGKGYADVPVGTIYSHPREMGEDLPALILIHDFTRTNQDWLSTTFFIDLLEAGYIIAAINLRGHGDTPLPDGRGTFVEMAAMAELERAEPDLENSYLDVQTTLDWLEEQPGVDAERIGVIGAGLGANVAYVAKGVFPTRIRTAVALSPVSWKSRRDTSITLAVGEGLPSFTPQNTLFIVGEIPLVVFPNIKVTSTVAFTQELAEQTAEPKEVDTVAILCDPASPDCNPVYGIGFFCDPAEDDCNSGPRDGLLKWLEDNL